MTAQDRLIFYIDGASHGNPGPAGIGIIICDKNAEVIGNICEYIGENTNNAAEYTALIHALQEGLLRKAGSITINTDSEFLVKQLNGEYKVKDEKIKQYFGQVQRLLRGFKQVEIKYIRRSENKGADKLAAKAVNSAVKKKSANKQATFLFKNPDK